MTWIISGRVSKGRKHCASNQIVKLYGAFTDKESSKPSAYLVLSQQEGQQHQHASIMNHPPHIDGALPEAVLVSGETVHVFSDQHGLVGCRGLTHYLCMNRRRKPMGGRKIPQSIPNYVVALISRCSTLFSDEFWCFLWLIFLIFVHLLKSVCMDDLTAASELPLRPSV